MRKQTRLWLTALPLTLLGACEQSAPTDLAPRSLALSDSRPSGNVAPSVTVYATGLQNPRGIAFGPGGTLYVAEAGSGGTTSNGVTFPTSLRFGPDGALYVTNKGFGVPLGTGEILRISLQ
jgi:glucose/arabinose dehydrogenase